MDVDSGFDQAGFLSRCGKLSFAAGLANLYSYEGFYANAYATDAYTWYVYSTYDVSISILVTSNTHL